MGLLDLFKRKDSVPEKVESCEKRILLRMR